MPRPATPLSVLLLIAFGLLMVAVLSTPIIKAIPLGTFDGFTFGVFGYCKPDGECLPLEIGYDTSNIFADESSFNLPSSARNTLSGLLIVHPVAALIVLVYFVMAIIAHVHSASHSSRYLLCLFLVGLLGFVLCLLAFLVDVLLFVPHLAWGSYLVLSSTILVAISCLVSCMMRRSMVGRKARRNKVKDNSEMNGENYFARTESNNVATTASETTMVQQPTVPMLSGANGQDGNSLPKFATYDSPKKDDQGSDEHIPLTAISPSNRSPNITPSDINSNNNNNNNNYYDTPNSYAPPLRSNTGGSSPQPRDQYGNPMGPSDGYGAARGPSTERMNNGRGGMPPPGYRGRGGYGPPPGRGGGYGPNGGYGSRGRGHGPQRGGSYGPRGGGYGPRGAYGPSGMMRGGRTPPPPAGPYQGSSYNRTPSPGNGYGDPYQGQRMSPQTISPQPSPYPPATMNAPIASYQAYAPDTESPLPIAESPPPLQPSALSQAVEMDATSNPAAVSLGAKQFNTIRDSDTDVAGMVALQQGSESSSGQQRGQAPSPLNPSSQQDTALRAGQYSTDDQYLPARQNWNGTPGPIGEALGSPQGQSLRTQDQPVVELPVGATTPRSQGSDRVKAPPAAESDYYEDVDPRFAEPTTEAMPMPHASLTPVPLNIPTTGSSTPYEDIPAGARSPAESERSTFTSISQRGVNPRWNGGPHNPPIMPQQISRRPFPPRAPAGPDIFVNNPDFELPTGGTRRGPGTIPNSAYPTGL